MVNTSRILITKMFHNIIIIINTCKDIQILIFNTPDRYPVEYIISVITNTYCYIGLFYYHSSKLFIF